MRRANVVEKDMASIGTLKDLTNVFESLASTQVAKVKNKAQLSQEFFNLLWERYTAIRVDPKKRLTTERSHNSRTVFILISAEAGLSGDLDMRMIESMQARYDKETTDIIVLGSHGASQLSQRGIPYIRFFQIPESDSYINVTPIIDAVAEYEHIVVYFEEYLSLGQQEVRSIDLISQVKEMSADEYQLNVNSANGYFITNTTQSVDNEISNPGFEAGGSIGGGEEGWFGSTSQTTFPNDPANARTGNYSMRILNNGSDMDFYAGSYREITAGDSYYLSGYLKKVGGANGSAGVQITWYDKDKAVISYSSNYNTSGATTYLPYTVSANAPSNAVYARVSATVRSNATSGQYHFDDFSFTHNQQSAPYSFRNGVNSTAAFRIQSANATQTLFTANTTDNILKVGDSTGTDTATTLLVLDGATTDPTTLANRNGGLYYNTATNSLKAVIGGSVVDVCTTAVTCSGYSASAGSSVQLQTSSPGTQQVGNFNISGTGLLTALKTQDSATGNSSNLTIKTGNAGGTGSSGNLILDVGTGGSSPGSIQIGHAGVSTTMAGTLAIQGGNSLTLGSTSAATGSIAFNNAIGPNKVTLRGPSANPISSPSNGGTASDYTLTLPSQMGDAGNCLKTNATGEMYFQNCGVGANVNLQDVYNNSGTPATLATTDGKDVRFVASDTANDANILINLQCTTNCDPDSNQSTPNRGLFAVQNAGTNVFSVDANGGNILVGSAITDTTMTLLQLDSYNGDASDETSAKTCTTTRNQGALYYNSRMGSLRGCINGGWTDISNPDTLGLLTFGIIPSSGGPNNSYDLPSLINPGASGPCKVSRASATTVSIQPCTAYSGGRRVSVESTVILSTAGDPARPGSTTLSTSNRWGHICLSGANSAPAFTSSTGSASATDNMPAFNVSAPILCLADIQSSTSGAGTTIEEIYDTRTFSSSMKEAVNTSTAAELGMLVDSGTSGRLVPAASGSKKLYGTVVATDGNTSAGAPNAIVTTIGPAWVKATSGTAGSFVIASTTNGYATTNSSIPNNSFYYSAGNTRTSFNSTCTSASNCTGSLYVNFVVR